MPAAVSVRTPTGLARQPNRWQIIGSIRVTAFVSTLHNLHAIALSGQIHDIGQRIVGSRAGSPSRPGRILHGLAGHLPTRFTTACGSWSMYIVHGARKRGCVPGVPAMLDLFWRFSSG